MKKIIVIGAALLFGIVFTSGALAAGESDSKTQTTQMEEQSSTLQASAEQPIGTTQKLIGETVNGQEGKKIGHISDLMVDSNTGRINFVILSSSGVLGIGKDQYIVPWKALHQDSKTKVFSLNISEQKLKEAPQGETVATREQATKIYQFYGVAPYWEESGPTEQKMYMKGAPMMQAPMMQQAPGTMEEEPKK